MTTPQVKPTLQALLVADHVYTDAATGKKIVAGIFHTIFRNSRKVAPDDAERGQVQVEIPAAGFQMGAPFAYISLINVRELQRFLLRYVSLADDSVRFQAEFAIECKDPLSPVEVVLPLLPLPSDKDGAFALELLWHDEPLGTYRIHVRPHPEAPHREADRSHPNET